MKKLILIILSFVPVLSLFSFASAEEPMTKPQHITVSELEALTEEICVSVKERTSFTAGIEGAAIALSNMLSGYGLSSSVQEFTVKKQVYENMFTATTKEYKSYNVVAETTPISGRKTVLITAPYANHYSDNPVMSGTGAEGALGTATSTALLITLAHYYEQHVEENVYNYRFALFSGTDEGNYGSRLYVENSANSLDDVILNINFERLGGGNVYYYTDEAATEHGKFIKEVAKDYAMRSFPQTGRVLLDMSTVSGLDYTHYAMLGDNATFMSEGKSCLELIGGSFRGLTSGDGKGFATNTKYDTFEHLCNVYPDYAEKLMTAGEFIIDLTSRAELKDVCLGAAQGYKVFTKTWIAYAIGLGIIVILILLLLLVTGRLEKKYPIPAQPKIKVAVFGSEYEDPKEDEIVVDIKHNDDNNDGNPFDI